MITILCDNCGRLFDVYPSSLIKGKKFCSRKCMGAGASQRLKGKPRPCMSKEKHPLWKGGAVDKICSVCGIKYVVPYAQRKSVVCSMPCFGVWKSKNITGSKSSNWRGGVTPLNLRQRTSKQNKEWRLKVFERDGYTCQRCGDKRGGNLRAHHIKPFSDFPELRFKVSNGETLCESCHKIEHRKRKAEQAN